MIFQTNESYPATLPFKLKNKTVPTLKEVADTGHMTYDRTIGHVIPGPVLGYLKAIAVTRLRQNYDQRSSIITR